MNRLNLSLLIERTFAFRQKDLNLNRTHTLLRWSCILTKWRYGGAWIAEWSSHSNLTIGMLCPGPWVQASMTSNSFLDPSTTSMLYLWFYLVCLIWYYYLSVKFVMWIVKQKIENKRNLFLLKTRRRYRSCRLKLGWSEKKVRTLTTKTPPLSKVSFFYFAPKDIQVTFIIVQRRHEAQ